MPRLLYDMPELNYEGSLLPEYVEFNELIKSGDIPAIIDQGDYIKQNLNTFIDTASLHTILYPIKRYADAAVGALRNGHFDFNNVKLFDFMLSISNYDIESNNGANKKIIREICIELILDAVDLGAEDILDSLEDLKDTSLKNLILSLNKFEESSDAKEQDDLISQIISLYKSMTGSCPDHWLMLKELKKNDKCYLGPGEKGRSELSYLKFINEFNHKINQHRVDIMFPDLEPGSWDADYQVYTLFRSTMELGSYHLQKLVKNKSQAHHQESMKKYFLDALDIGRAYPEAGYDMVTEFLTRFSNAYTKNSGDFNLADVCYFGEVAVADPNCFHLLELISTTASVDVSSLATFFYNHISENPFDDVVYGFWGKSKFLRAVKLLYGIDSEQNVEESLSLFEEVIKDKSQENYLECAYSNYFILQARYAKAEAAQPTQTQRPIPLTPKMMVPSAPQEEKIAMHVQPVYITVPDAPPEEMQVASVLSAPAPAVIHLVENEQPEGTPAQMPAQAEELLVVAINSAPEGSSDSYNVKLFIDLIKALEKKNEDEIQSILSLLKERNGLADVNTVIKSGEFKDMPPIYWIAKNPQAIAFLENENELLAKISKDALHAIRQSGACKGTSAASWMISHTACDSFGDSLDKHLFVKKRLFADKREPTEEGLEAILCTKYYRLEAETLTVGDWIATSVRAQEWKAIVQDRKLNMENNLLRIKTKICKTQWKVGLFGRKGIPDFMQLQLGEIKLAEEGKQSLVDTMKKLQKIAADAEKDRSLLRWKAASQFYKNFFNEYGKPIDEEAIREERQEFFQGYRRNGSFPIKLK